MGVMIRKGQPGDADVAAPLILSAAEALIAAVFGHNDKQTALNYLMHAWEHGDGQYGCHHHWVATQEDKPLGVVTAWHTKLGAAFDRATLDSITSFFSMDEAISILMRNQTIAVKLTPPTPNELMIGHVAVVASAQGLGVGRKLIEHMVDYGITLNKQKVVLDVELKNTAAIRFYQRLQFNEDSVNGSFVRFERLL